MYTDTYICGYVRTYVRTYEDVHSHIDVHTHICMFTYTHVFVEFVGGLHTEAPEAPRRARLDQTPQRLVPRRLLQAGRTT